MAKEIELKLSLPAEQRQKFLRLGLLRQAVSRQTQTLINRYYDTPSLDLQQHGMALRTRKQGRRWLQTVKCAGNSVGGLSSRPEWETDYTGNFDFSHLDDPWVRGQLEHPEIRDRLTVLFETRFQRTTWRLEPRPGCTLLLMLDHGEILAAGRRASICEVEIELADSARPDNIDAMFDLAESLSAHCLLHPASKSKAERGYQLFFGKEILPRKAKTTPFEASDTPRQIFRKIALECLEHLQSNFEGAVAGQNPEFIHQMRVATRRFCAALRLFSPWLPDGHLRETKDTLRQLARQLGPVRNFDVLLTEILAPALEASSSSTAALASLRITIEQQRQAARQAALQHLSSADHARFMLNMTRLLQKEMPEPKRKTKAGKELQPLPEALRARLKRSLKKLQHLAASTKCHDPASLHRLRIDIKRLRHALEFSSPHLETKGRDKLLSQLIALQEELGQLNDLAHAGPLLLQGVQDDPTLLAAVTLLGQHHLDRYRTLLAGLPEKLECLGHARCPHTAHAVRTAHDDAAPLNALKE